MNTKKSTKIACLIILLLILNIQTIQADEQASLSLKLSPNQKYGMRMTSKMNSSETSQSQEEMMEVAFEVEDVNSLGDILMKVRFKKMQTKKEHPKITAIYNALVGQSFMMRVAPNGRILELQSLDNMFHDMAEKVVKENPTYGTKEKAKGLIMFLFSEEKIRTMMRSFIQVLPAQPVKPGDTWESIIDEDFLQYYGINLKNTLKDYENNNAIIDVVYKRSLDEKPIKDKKLPSLTITKIDYSGTSQINKSNGWIIHKEVKLSFTGESINQGVKTPLSGDMTRIIEQVEQESPKNAEETVQQTTEAFEDLLIRPGIGIGKIKFGMTVQQMKDLLGEPDVDATGISYMYKSLGIEIIAKDKVNISAILCGNFSHRNEPMFKAMEDAFKLKTAEGIGIGSTEDEVIKAFGQPTKHRGDKLLYKDKRMSFTLHGDKVIGIWVSK